MSDIFDTISSQNNSNTTTTTQQGDIFDQVSTQSTVQSTIQSQPSQELSKVAWLAAKGTADIIPGAAYAGLFYKHLISGKGVGESLKAADYEIQPYESLKPDGLGEQLAYEAPKQVGRLLAMYGPGIKALQAATGLGPIVSGSLGFGGISGTESVMEGKPKDALHNAITSAVTFPLMYAGGLAGRLAPENNLMLSRILTGAGFGGVSAAMAPEGEKMAQGILGGGLGALMPQEKLTEEDLSNAEFRTKGFLESRIRSFINNVTDKLDTKSKSVISWWGGIKKEALDRVSEVKSQGGNFGDIDTTENRNIERARTLIGDVQGLPKEKQTILNYLKNTKETIGAKVGLYYDKVKGEQIDLSDILPGGQKIETTIVKGKSPSGVDGFYTTDLSGNKEFHPYGVVGEVKSRAEAEKALRKKFAGVDRETVDRMLGLDKKSESDLQLKASEAALQLPDYLKLLQQRLINIDTVGKAKIVMEKIAERVDTRVDLDQNEAMLMKIYHQIGNKIGQVGEAKYKGFADKYQKSKNDYANFMMENSAIKKGLGIKDSSWKLEPDAQNLVGKLEKLVWGSGKLTERIAGNKQLFSNIKDFLTAQEFQGGNPSMWRSRIARIIISGIVGQSGAGPVGALGGMLTTLPGFWKQLYRGEQALGGIRQQLTTIRAGKVEQAYRQSNP